MNNIFSNIILIISIISSIIGILAGVKNLIETRKKYYHAYLKRKRNGD
jgi:hypothetical protein